MPKFLTAALPWLIVAALAFVIVGGKCGKTAPAINKATQAQIDTLKARGVRDSLARIQDSIAIAAERARGDSLAEVARRASERAAASRAAANRAGARADSAAKAKEWERAYVERTRERDTLIT